MTLKIDDFVPVSNSDLRELWLICRDPALRRLILEVVRYRRVIDCALGEAQRIARGLDTKNSGEVAGASRSLVERLVDERVRLGSQGGRVIKLETDGQYAGKRW